MRLIKDPGYPARNQPGDAIYGRYVGNVRDTQLDPRGAGNDGAGKPVREKRYLDTRLGPSVKAYLSWKENEVGAAERTVDQYERDLARMCAMLANHGIHEVTADELREVRDSFPKGWRPRVSAALRDYWRWLYEEGRIGSNPMARVRNPKREPPQVQDVFSEVEEQRLISGQQAIRDKLGVALLLDAGPRAAEIEGFGSRTWI